MHENLEFRFRELVDEGFNHLIASLVEDVEQILARLNANVRADDGLLDGILGTLDEQTDKGEGVDAQIPRIGRKVQPIRFVHHPETVCEVDMFNLLLPI